MTAQLQLFKIAEAACQSGKDRLPAFTQKIAAGFPSPAEDYQEPALSIGEMLAPNPESSFIVQVSGWSMKNAGIFDKDWLIVDKSLQVESGKIVVAWIQGEGFLVKRLRVDGLNQAWLDSENENFEPIRLTEEMNAEFFGVVRAKAGLLS